MNGPADTASLRAGLRRSRRRRQLLAVALVSPLLLFTMLAFVSPLTEMLRRSVWNDEFSSAMPGFSRALRELGEASRGIVPDEPLFALLAAEMKGIAGSPAAASAARRLNYDLVQGRSLFQRTATMLEERTTGPDGGWKETLIAFDARWGQPQTWAALDRAARPLTDFFVLAALDLRHDDVGNIVRKPESQAIYVDVLLRTMTISFSVTMVCLLLGFPVAYLLSVQPPSRANWMLLLVLVPFWTPLLVRTASWVVVLQETGLVNQVLAALHVVDAPVRLLYNRTDVVIAMTHVLLPFMILPLYSVMKGVPREYLRAAASLGAPPLTVFRAIYVPLVAPGIAAGALLVFILAIGYYVTPALVGGAGDQMISHFVAFNVNQTVNWSMAAALGLLLLVATLVLFFVSSRLGRGSRLGVLG